MRKQMFCSKVSADIWISSSMQERRDEVALRTTCMKNVKFKIIKRKIGCQYVGCFTTAKT